MGEQEKVKKICVPYLLVTIFGPLVLMVGLMALSMILPLPLNYIVFIGAFTFALCWWFFLERKVYDGARKKKLDQLDRSGFVRDQTYIGDWCTVTADVSNRRVALMFRWNPGKMYVRPAGQVTRVWVDDGRGGPGFRDGTSRVSFLFTIDGVTVRVNTFASSKRLRADCDQVLAAVSKAEEMAEALRAAGAGGMTGRDHSGRRMDE